MASDDPQEPTLSTFEYKPENVPHIPRAWERAPKPSFAPSHKGRKVWKRYDFKATDLDPLLNDHTNRQDGSVENILPPIKRQCLKEAPPEIPAHHRTSRPARFLATLRDYIYGSPKRKSVKCTSFLHDEPQGKNPGDEELVGLEAKVNPQSGWLEDTILSPNFTARNGCTKELVLGSDHCVPTADDEKMQLSQHVASPSRSEYHSTYNMVEKLAANRDLTPTTSVEDVIVHSEPIENSKPLEMETEVQTSAKEGYNGIAHNSLIDLSRPDNVVGSENSDAKDLSNLNMKSTNIPDVLFDYVKDENTLSENAFPLYSMDIGNFEKENQILSATSINARPEKEDCSSSTDNIPGSPICDVSTGSLIDLPIGKGSQLDRPFAETSDRQTPSPPSPKDSLTYPDVVKENFPPLDTNKDQYELTQPDVAKEIFPPLDADKGQYELTEASNEPIVPQLNACLEIDRADERSDSHENALLVELISAEREQECQNKVSDNTASQSERAISDDSYADRTRSGARFSDDTNMLKDFLSRAQARKAATSTALPNELEAPSPIRRSPRKVLGQLDNNKSTPPPVSTEASRKPCSPLDQLAVDVLANDEEEAPEEPVSIRRSTRKRLPVPVKTLTSATSFISVRRTDGADPVVMQKSTAHELLIVTRANTKRNQGKSKMPKLVLQDLSSRSSEVAELTRPTAVGGKVVSWDERLVQYQEALEQQEREDVQPPKIRRLRGLGVANGTPAPRRLAKDASMPRVRGAR